MISWEKGENTMKLFISWSGELSKKVADALNKWLPCLLQTIQVFYSPDDIEKGENWDQRISTELSNCNYGLICLTSDNTTAPWVNFEAGAIAKALGSHVATLMINVNPSDIKGPLSRYQATKIDKRDFQHLVQDINRNLETPIEDDRLINTFEGLWPNIEGELNNIIKGNSTPSKASKKSTEKNAEAIEEILQLIRKQNSLLTNPEALFPRDYLEYIFERVMPNSIDVLEELLNYLEFVYRFLRESEPSLASLFFSRLNILEFINSIGNDIPARNNRSTIVEHYISIRRKYSMLERKINSTDPTDE